MTTNKRTVRPEIFEAAAELIAIGNRKHTCVALDEAGANKAETNLWMDLHTLPNEKVTWFYNFGVRTRRILREQCLREVSLNLREQGFCK